MDEYKSERNQRAYKNKEETHSHSGRHAYIQRFVHQPVWHSAVDQVPHQTAAYFAAYIVIYTFVLRISHNCTFISLAIIVPWRLRMAMERTTDHKIYISLLLLGTQISKGI